MNLTPIRALFFAALIFSFPASALTESDHNSDTQKSEQPRAVNPNAKQEGAAAPSYESNRRSEKRENNEERCEYGGPAWFSGFYCFFAVHDKFWVAFGTLILAAGTAVLGFATVFLWRATRDLVSDAKTTGTEQLKISMKAVDAAMLAAGSERAWMSFENLYPGTFEDSFIDQRPVARGMRFRIKWINCGRSPAIGVETVVNHQIAPMEQVMPAVFAPPEPPEWSGAVPIGPGLPVHSTDIAIGDADLDSFINRQTKIFIYSRVLYRDVFNSNVLRVSEICLVVSCNGMRPHPHGGMQPNLHIATIGPQNSCT